MIAPAGRDESNLLLRLVSEECASGSVDLLAVRCQFAKMARAWRIIPLSSSTPIIWGFSHGASHPSGTPSGVWDSDPGRSDAIGGQA